MYFTATVITLCIFFSLSLPKSQVPRLLVMRISRQIVKLFYFLNTNVLYESDWTYSCGRLYYPHYRPVDLRTPENGTGPRHCKLRVCPRVCSVFPRRLFRLPISNAVEILFSRQTEFPNLWHRRLPPLFNTSLALRSLPFLFLLIHVHHLYLLQAIEYLWKY